MIPREKIDEIIERVSIVEVISGYLPLKKRGANYVALCPFHAEKTPSFTVNEDKKLFYCFGCHTGGSVITFLMRQEGLSFTEAVRTLARRYGIELKEYHSPENRQREELFKALLLSEHFFCGMLKSREGLRAREYLKARGLTEDVIEQFRIGYAPAGAERLCEYLRKKGINPATFERTGFIRKRDRGHYSIFVNRIIFPIKDVRGRTVGFGGRVLDGGEPKYLNSSDSEVFKKGSILYGFWQAKEAIRKKDRALVVEGYFDLISLHMAGITEAVATMGTALTQNHIRTLRSYTTRIYTLFDGDEAGRKAALRGLATFLDEEVIPRVVLIDGTDPDEFVRKNGASALLKKVEQGIELFDFYLAELKKHHPTDSAEGKMRYLKEVLPYLKTLKDPVRREHCASQVAFVLGVSPQAVMDAMKEKAPRKEKKERRPALDLIELTILKVVLRNPHLYNARVEEALERFKDPFLKGVAEVVKKGFNGRTVREVLSLAELTEDDRIKAFITETVLKEEDGFIEKPERMLQDSIDKIMRRDIMRPSLNPSVIELVKRLEESGREEMAKEILQRLGIRKEQLERGH